MDLRPEQQDIDSFKIALAQLEPIRRAIYENEDWYRDVVEHSQDLLCVHDLGGRLLCMNPTPARLLGYSVEELLRIPMRDLIAPEYRRHFDEYLVRIEAEGEARGLLVVITRSGERRIWEYSNSLRREDIPEPIVRGMARDVTDQKRAEKLLCDASELNRQIVAGAGEGIIVFDKDLRCISWNPFMERLTGVSCADAVGKSYGALVPPEIKFHDSGMELNRALRGETVMVPDEKLPTANGFRWVSTRKGPLRNAAGEITGVIVTVQDITERKAAEEQLLASESRYRTLHESSPVGVCWVESVTGRFLGVNPKFCEIVGRPPEDLLGRTFQSITHPEDLELNLQKLRQMVDGEIRSYEMEKRYIRPDNSVRWVETEIVAMWPRGEKPSCSMAITQDITERREAQERLKEYERVLEGLDEMVVVIDRDYKYVIANRAFLTRRQLQREQVIGRPVSAVLLNGAFESTVKEKVDECFRGTIVQYEMNYLYPEIGERRISLTYFPIEGLTGIERIVCILHDVTERKRAEAALKSSEERERGRATELQTILDTLPIPVLIAHDPQCLKITTNRAGAHHFKVPEGVNISSAAPLENRVRFRYLQDGVDIPLEQMPLRRTVDTKRPVHDFPTTLVLEDGTERYELGNAAPLLDSNGNVRGAVAATLDITGRIRAEQTLRQITEELRAAKEKLAEEKLYLEETIDTEMGFGEIIGRSSALAQVMQKVAKVAPSDATVLLLGETGTGKELVARALHHSSKRNGKSFIKLNCAAIPSGLLESELFGHEKGAFTGAVARKLGRLELADGGTLFLDEIGEIALSLQPKLLRVLQDMEFERLGGTQTLKVNFRLLAATNRDLLKSVNAREFRSDLYYRLNVFPIVIPPLRDRREDIRPLAEHFVRKFSAQLKKSITSIPSKTMELLVGWSWPGNIRELENFLERSVILTPGSVLQAPLAELESDGEIDDSHFTLGEKDRERILQALRECHGKLGGADGAAARLGLKRTTLQSRLDLMGIKPKAYRAYKAG